MKIAIVGCGYVGLVSGTCIANLGNDVICVDINPEIIEKLNSGIIPIYEPGLSELVKENIKAKRLKFTLNLKEAVENSEIIFLAVNTPQSDNGEANLTISGGEIGTTGAFGGTLGGSAAYADYGQSAWQNDFGAANVALDLGAQGIIMAAAFATNAYAGSGLAGGVAAYPAADQERA